jgi:hypothetical protein
MPRASGTPSSSCTSSKCWGCASPHTMSCSALPRAPAVVSYVEDTLARVKELRSAAVSLAVSTPAVTGSTTSTISSRSWRCSMRCRARSKATSQWLSCARRISHAPMLRLRVRSSRPSATPTAALAVFAPAKGTTGTPATRRTARAGTRRRLSRSALPSATAAVTLVPCHAFAPSLSTAAEFFGILWTFWLSDLLLCSVKSPDSGLRMLTQPRAMRVRCRTESQYPMVMTLLSCASGCFCDMYSVRRIWSGRRRCENKRR